MVWRAFNLKQKTNSLVESSSKYFQLKSVNLTQMQNIIPVSIVVIASNAADTITNMLESVIDFDEAVIYINNSLDTTTEIANSYKNTKVINGEFIGYGPTKNKAISLAKNDWVLCLDADEAVSPELSQYLLTLDFSNEAIAYQVLRQNFFMGKHVDKAGWGQDWLIRLFNRKRHQYNNSLVHETVELQTHSKLVKLPYPITHNAVQNIGQFINKIDRYSEIYRQSSTKTYSAPVIVLKSAYAFIRSYFIQGGFLAGWRGLIIAWNESNGTFYKYMKRYVDKQS